ncbi:hypothetical protein AgCh_016329 [Apium graveolens]
MEEIPPDIEVTVSLSSSICDNSGISGNVEITRVQIVTESSNLLPDPVSVLRAESVSSRERSFNSLKRTFSGAVESERKISVSETVLNGDSSWVPIDAMIQQNKDDMAADCGIKSKQLLALNASTGISLPIAVEIGEIDNGQVFAKVISLEKQSVEGKMSVSADDVSSNILTLKTSVVALQLPKEKITETEGSRGVVPMKYVPLWGHVSICGKRPEMEDAVAAMPQFLEVPKKMILGEHVINGISQNAGLITTHFFGVYDGHGGSQVANYCRDRIHFVLKEKLKGVRDNETEAKVAVTQQVQWEEIFTSCFQKIDDEVGGKVSQSEPGGDCDTSSGNLEPVAPETVGSTAVVALLCSSHIIVANCGDSRAVLYRGKEAMALSNDHKVRRICFLFSVIDVKIKGFCDEKSFICFFLVIQLLNFVFVQPNREDENARIEASGGKVIQWNGHRVFGVLAMSRSIGNLSINSHC